MDFGGDGLLGSAGVRSDVAAGVVWSGDFGVDVLRGVCYPLTEV